MRRPRSAKPIHQRVPARVVHVPIEARQLWVIEDAAQVGFLKVPTGQLAIVWVRQRVVEELGTEWLQSLRKATAAVVVLPEQTKPGVPQEAVVRQPSAADARAAVEQLLKQVVDQEIAAEVKAFCASVMEGVDL